MQTDSNIDETLKGERRKVFHALNILPWLLLVLVLSGINIYQYKNRHTLNNIEAVAPVAPVAPESRSIVTTNETNEIKYTELTVTNFVIITNRMWLTNAPNDSFRTNVITKFVVITNWITATNWINVTNTIGSEILVNRFLDFESQNRNAIKGELQKQFDVQKEQIYNNALYDFQVDAVSNNHAQWNINVRGERSFKWISLTNQDVVKRSFGVSDFAFAKSIGMNVENEIEKIIISTIDIGFHDRTREEDQKLKKSLQAEITRQVNNLFDGFEALRK